MTDRPLPDDEDASPDSQTAASGILHCLEMLEEEAENFRLPRTRFALRKAIRACKADSLERFTPRLRRLTLH